VVNGDAVQAAAAQAGPGGLEIWIDGRRSLSTRSVVTIGAVCDHFEDQGPSSVVIIHVSGVPREPLARDLTVGLVSKWERALRRLERLPAVTIAVADGDCGGLALDALLTADYRIASPSVRLLLPMSAGGTWPGMALYRLARQAGESAIRQAVLFGSPIEASDALAMHLLDELTGDPAGAVPAAASRAAPVRGAELAIRRQLMSEAPFASFEDALGVHLAACDRVLRQVSTEAAR
jgi:isomerase DpgB